MKISIMHFLAINEYLEKKIIFNKKYLFFDKFSSVLVNFEVIIKRLVQCTSNLNVI